VLLFLSLFSPISAQVFASLDRPIVDSITYADVAPIVQNNCTVCHRPGGIGPMDLITYEDVRRYSRRIKEQVSNKLMPPYYYDNDIGIQDLEYDWRLSQAQIDTIVTWVDQGSQLGNPADVPPPSTLIDTNEWSFAPELGQPDVVVSSTPIDVPANGLDMWHRPIVPTGVTEDRCIRAIQVKPQPGAKGVVHHANSTFQRLQDDNSFEATGDRASEYAMGKLGELIPDGVCRILPANSYVAWDLHLFPGGLGAAAANSVVEDNVVDMGIWLWPVDYQYEYKQDLALYPIRSAGELVLKPHGTAMMQGFRTFDHPVRIDSFQPHGHLRLRSASLEILYPETGRIEVISMISNWSAVWHQSHIYSPNSAPLVPVGAVLIMKQWYDNTENNPNVVDPDLWVDDGSRTGDEMSHAWIAVTHLDEEGYQELVTERREKLIS
jgi:hypothetical protein